VQTEYPKYFDALNKHPRMLVGTEVPAAGRDGLEVLQDETDAASWQAATKQLLVQEVKSRASKAMDDNGDFLTTLHASIELFQNNPDLVPGSAEFDVDLANRFAVMATPYELRVDGKLQGYSIPVQPLIEQLRNQVVASRATTPPPPPPPAAAAAATSPAADPPQAGIPSKAGNGSQAEDFSVLFGTLGLPNLRI
jgi:hypothetical protein